jgi:hypothetical protein
MLKKNDRHPRAGGGPTPAVEIGRWIPAFAGMTVIFSLLTACSTAPRQVSERDMPGIFSADATPGSRALMVQFLNDGRFGGDTPQPGGVVQTQGYWRMGTFDEKRRCTVIETKPRQGEWREGFCASIENERTALNCKGEGDARSCLMSRRPGKWKA